MMKNVNQCLFVVVIACASTVGQAATTINFGTGDSLALDQMRVVVAFEDEFGTVTPPSSFGGFTMIADTGATGYLIGLGGHFNWNTLLTDPNLYTLDAQYLEQGVGGTESVGLTALYDVTIAQFAGFFNPAPPGIVQFTLAGQRMLTTPSLYLGSFDGIVGMPGMAGKAVIANLSNMTPEATDTIKSIDLISVGFDSALPTAPGAGNTHTFNFSKLSFDPTAGQINPSDPLPSHQDLPAITVRTGLGVVEDTGTFLFDSGAQLSMISGDTARDLGINIDLNDVNNDIVELLPVGGVGGSIDIPVVTIDRLELDTNAGDTLVFENLSVGVLDIDGLPVDGILGFNIFTTGYLTPVIEALIDPTSAAAQQDGAFVEMAFDFTGATWSMRLTENPDYVTTISGVEFSDTQFFALENQALMSWPPFGIPEPMSATMMILCGGALCLRRRGPHHRWSS